MLKGKGFGKKAGRRGFPCRNEKSFAKKLLFSPIMTSGLALLIIAPIVISLSTFHLYDKNAIRGILTEAHGMLFDIVVFGIFMILLNKITERRTEIKRYNENIFDCRYWDSPEAIIRTVANIRRLNDLGFSKVTLNFHNLFKANLHNVNLKGAKVVEADLSLATMSDSDFSDVVFEGSILVGVEMEDTDLSNSQLVECDLRGANLKRAVLDNVNFTGANLQGVKNLTIGQLKQVATLYGARLDKRLLVEVENRCPEKLADVQGRYRVNDIELFERWKKNREKVSRQYKEQVG